MNGVSGSFILPLLKLKLLLRIVEKVLKVILGIMVGDTKEVRKE